MMRCWYCGIEPDGLFDITSMERAEPIRIVRWPEGVDHEHSDQPPTPTQLEQQGYESLLRIQTLAP